MGHDAHGKYSGKRLIVFGCGYVGAEVARQAVALGLSVTALTRNASKAVDLRGQGIDVLVAELGDEAWHRQIEGGAEFVLNCVSSGGGGLEGYRRSYRDGMASILSWARSCGAVGTLVYTGSTSVYGQSGGAKVDELASTEGAGERAMILLETENLLKGSSGGCGRWFVLRLAGIYGPGRHHLLEQVRTGEVAGLGHHRLNLIYRDDICSAVWAAFRAGPGVHNETINLADDGAATKADVANWLAARLGMAPPRFTGAPAAGRREVTPDRIILNAKAKTVLGWRPDYPSFRAGYEKILSR